MVSRAGLHSPLHGTYHNACMGVSTISVNLVNLEASQCPTFGAAVSSIARIALTCTIATECICRAIRSTCEGGEGRVREVVDNPQYSVIIYSVAGRAPFRVEDLG